MPALPNIVPGPPMVGHGAKSDVSVALERLGMSGGMNDERCI